MTAILNEKRTDFMDKQRIEAAVREILIAIGEDPDREGLVETPSRVARMYEEIFGGLEDDPTRHLKLFDESSEEKMRTAILAARSDLNSIGGIVECAAVGMPAGVGSPMMDGLENIISRLVFAIPAVKGIEFGNGFGCADLFGSENNDEFSVRDEKIVTLTNNHGGILGGISSGMPIIFRVAFKPTPSISRPQKSVDFKNMTEQELVIKGRHDPCVVARAVPCVESALNIALVSALSAEGKL